MTLKRTSYANLNSCNGQAFRTEIAWFWFSWIQSEISWHLICFRSFADNHKSEKSPLWGRHGGHWRRSGSHLLYLQLKGENQQWLQGKSQPVLSRLKDNFAISPGDVSAGYSVIRVVWDTFAASSARCLQLLSPPQDVLLAALWPSYYFMVYLVLFYLSSPSVYAEQ